MKYIKYTFIANIAILASPMPVMAQNATGSVQVTGNVAPKCMAQSPISDTIALGELAQANGRVDTQFGSNVGGLSRSFTIVCTSAAVQLAVSSSPLQNSTDASTEGGYTGRVQYTATLEAMRADGGSKSVSYTTADTLPEASTADLGDRLSNSESNVKVYISNGSTTNDSDLLKSGTYTGMISVSIEPK